MGLWAGWRNCLGKAKKLKGLSHSWVLFYAFLLIMSSWLQEQEERWAIYVVKRWD